VAYAGAVGGAPVPLYFLVTITCKGYFPSDFFKRLMMKFNN
jgi:hypothetical protein